MGARRKNGSPEEEEKKEKERERKKILSKASFINVVRLADIINAIQSRRIIAGEEGSSAVRLPNGTWGENLGF